MTEARQHLVVATWNVLADAYVDRTRYHRSPPELLAPRARCSAIVAQLTRREPATDLFLLQEAEPSLVEHLAQRFGSDRVLWCPKGAGRPDGCCAVVTGDRLAVMASHRLGYDDALEPATTSSGHVAQVLELTWSDRRLIVANTHLRWAPLELAADLDGTPPTASRHIGVRQAHQLAAALERYELPVVVAADVNDPPGGPVRQTMEAAGYRSSDPIPSALVDTGPVALDVVWARNARIRSTTLAGRLDPPLPSPHMPSDHAPLVCDISVD